MSKNQSGMSLIAVMVAVAITGILAVTIMSLLDYMTRSSTRIALSEGMKYAVDNVYLCLQKTSGQCANCFYAAPSSSNARLNLGTGAGLVARQDIGSLREGATPTLNAAGPVPSEPRLTLADFYFEETSVATRIPTTIGGVAHQTLYGKIYLRFTGPASMSGGAFRAKEVPVAFMRNDTTGDVAACGLGGSDLENRSCSTTDPGCPTSTCTSPNIIYAVVTGFNSTGRPICGCYCIPPPGSPTSPVTTSPVTTSPVTTAPPPVTTSPVTTSPVISPVFIK